MDAHVVGSGVSPVFRIRNTEQVVVRPAVKGLKFVPQVAQLSFQRVVVHADGSAVAHQRGKTPQMPLADAVGCSAVAQRERVEPGLQMDVGQHAAGRGMVEAHLIAQVPVDHPGIFTNVGRRIFRGIHRKARHGEQVAHQRGEIFRLGFGLRFGLGLRFRLGLRLFLANHAQLRILRLIGLVRLGLIDEDRLRFRGAL